MNTWIAYWRWDPTYFRWVLYGFPRPGQDPPVLGYVSGELEEPDLGQARAVLVEKIAREHEVRINIVS